MVLDYHAQLNFMKQFGISQKAIIFNKNRKFLTIRRSPTAPIRPGIWDLPGGELDFGEQAFDGIIREIKEETGLSVKYLKPCDVESHINRNGDFWTTICYTAETVSDKVVLSFEHDDFKWVTRKEFLKLESSPKLRRFVTNLKIKKKL